MRIDCHQTEVGVLTAQSNAMLFYRVCSSPSIFFTTDDTGLFNSSNNHLNITTNGVNARYWRFFDCSQWSLMMLISVLRAPVMLTFLILMLITELVSLHRLPALLDVDGGDALIHGVTVGRGLGDDATNTVVGNNAETQIPRAKTIRRLVTR